MDEYSIDGATQGQVFVAAYPEGVNLTPGLVGLSDESVPVVLAEQGEPPRVIELRRALPGDEVLVWSSAGAGGWQESEPPQWVADRFVLVRRR